MGELLRRLIGNEQGAALIMTVLWLPVLLLIAAFVVDVGNWFQHKRHLQLQADAAALAAGGRFTFNPCLNAPIRAEAAKYWGDTYNAQVGGTLPENVHPLINSKTFWDQTEEDDTDVGEPCATKAVDVKLTESDLPSFFGLSPVKYINAQARVTLFQEDQAKGTLPVAVPAAAPRKARAVVINERTGSVLKTIDLDSKVTTGGSTQFFNGIPSSVTFNQGRDPIGVRVNLGYANRADCPASTVECYDATNPNAGIDFISTWQNDGSATQPNPPRFRGASLPGAQSSCSTPYFASNTAPCTFVLRADVDFGTAGANPSSTTAPGVSASMEARIGNGNNNAFAMTWQSGNTWQSAPITLNPASGPLPITLDWTVKRGTINGNNCGNGQGCKGTFGVVHRAFSAAGANSGPIQAVTVENSGVQDSNTYQSCSASQPACTNDLTIRVLVPSGLQNATSSNTPVVGLRILGGSSQNQSLDCDPAKTNLREELATGCGPTYEINKDTDCPNQGTLWASPNPPATWQCVAIQTGGAVGQVGEGMNQRILGDANATTCTSPNRWATNFPDFEGDPRVVRVFITPYSAFSGSGSGTVPVVDFGTFYVTGWEGNNGSSNPCSASNGGTDDPLPPGGGPGFIWGHFFKHADESSEGNPGTSICNFDQLGPCVPVLTR